MDDTTRFDRGNSEPTIVQQTVRQIDGIWTRFWEGNMDIRKYTHVKLLILAISSTGDPKSFAYSTSRERWPNILQNVIKDVKETISICNEEKAKEGGVVIAEVEELRKEILNDAVLE
jgi:hypothetical protein